MEREHEHSFPRRLYLMRHGDCRSDQTKRFIGQEDVPLNQEGLAAARAWQAILSTKGLGRVYCSDLTRSLTPAKSSPREAPPPWRCCLRSGRSIWVSGRGYPWLRFGNGFPANTRRGEGISPTFIHRAGKASRICGTGWCPPSGIRLAHAMASPHRGTCWRKLGNPLPHARHAHSLPLSHRTALRGPQCSYA